MTLSLRLLLLLTSRTATPARLPPTPLRDDDFYKAIVDLLTATGDFDDVAFAHSAQAALKAASGSDTLAIVSPGRAVQQDEGSSGRKNRQVAYTLTIRVLAGSIEEARAGADRLDAVAHNALDGASLAGASLPWQTGLREAVYSDGPGNFATITVPGRFGYSFDLSTGLRATL